jgi:hypothetical protein
VMAASERSAASRRALLASCSAPDSATAPVAADADAEPDPGAIGLHGRPGLPHPVREHVGGRAAVGGVRFGSWRQRDEQVPYAQGITSR